MLGKNVSFALTNFPYWILFLSQEIYSIKSEWVRNSHPKVLYGKFRKSQWRSCLENLTDLQTSLKEGRHHSVFPVNFDRAPFSQNASRLFFINENSQWEVVRFQSPVVFYKTMFLKTSQNPQENTCAKVSFSIKLLAWSLYLY